MTRSWGRWTEIKLEALEDYLRAFVVASRRARRTLYLDLFAGGPENESRGEERPIVASPERALAVSPPFTKLLFCELQERTAQDLDGMLMRKFPGRDFEVLAGDCNLTIPAALAKLDPEWRYAPTFAFLDQYCAQIRWTTIEHLSTFKNPPWKAELWMFFPDALIPRGAFGDEGVPRFEQFAASVDEMYGTPEWRVILRARQEGVLSAAKCRSELLNLMRWRLETVLGYEATIPITVTNANGTPIYTMVHATDHPAGVKIMTSVARKAGYQLESMRARQKVRRREEIDASRGITALFAEDADLMVDRARLNETFEAPRPPWPYEVGDEELL